jgi:hypothetical protein
VAVVYNLVGGVLVVVEDPVVAVAAACRPNKKVLQTLAVVVSALAAAACRPNKKPLETQEAVEDLVVAAAAVACRPNRKLLQTLAVV